MVGAVARALAFPQSVPGSIPICELSLLLVFYSAPRGFSPSTPVFPSPQKPTFLNSVSDLDYRQLLYHEPLSRVIAQALSVFDSHLHLQRSLNFRFRENTIAEITFSLIS